MSEQPKAPQFEIPDLEIEPAVSKRPPLISAARTLAPVPSSAAALELDGLGEDFELVPVGASHIELGEGFQRDVAPRPGDGTPWPTGRSRMPDELTIDSARVEQLADYGAAPTSALVAPLYTLRVYSRRAPLKQLISAQAEMLRQAETERDFALLQLADTLRPVLSQNDAFRRLLEPIAEVEKLSAERSAAFAQVSDGYRAQLQQFDAELASLREADARAAESVAERLAATEVTGLELQRAEAKHKRAQIEIRGVLDLARQAVGPAGGDIPPAHAARLAELRAHATALEPELARATSAHAATGAALEAASTERKAVLAAVARVERQKSDAGRAQEPQLTASAAGVSEAEKKRLAALSEVARAVLAARGSVPVPAESLHALRAHDDQVEGAATALETLVRALHSYDEARVRQGVILVLSALGLLVLAIFLKAVL